jgi:hypothetical protein
MNLLKRLKIHLFEELPYYERDRIGNVLFYKYTDVWFKQKFNNNLRIEYKNSKGFYFRNNFDIDGNLISSLSKQGRKIISITYF